MLANISWRWIKRMANGKGIKKRDDLILGEDTLNGIDRNDLMWVKYLVNLEEWLFFFFRILKKVFDKKKFNWFVCGWRNFLLATKEIMNFPWVLFISQNWKNQYRETRGSELAVFLVAPAPTKSRLQLLQLQLWL